MSRLTTIILAFLATLWSVTAIAQEPPGGQQAALQRLIDEQLRRIDALEARLASLQQQVNEMRGQQPPAAGEETQPVAYEHASGGAPPIDPDAEEPAADLP